MVRRTKNRLQSPVGPLYFSHVAVQHIATAKGYDPTHRSRRPHMITVEQIVNTQKSNIDTFFGLSGKAFEGVEKLIELNISAAKTAMAEAAQNTKLALSAKDPQELVALQTSLMQPAAEKAAAYGRYVYEIAASTGAEVSRVAEAQAAEAQALVALQTSLMQPAAEKAAAYGRYVYEIAASTGAEVSRVAEAQAAEAQAK